MTPRPQNHYILSVLKPFKAYLVQSCSSASWLKCFRRVSNLNARNNGTIPRTEAAATVLETTRLHTAEQQPLGVSPTNNASGIKQRLNRSVTPERIVNSVYNWHLEINKANFTFRPFPKHLYKRKTHHMLTIYKTGK